MPLVFTRHFRFIPVTSTITKFSRYICSSTSLTRKELHLHVKHGGKLTPQVRPVPQKTFAPRDLQPQTYNPQISSWVPYEKCAQKGLRRGEILKIVSWNINFFRPGPAARASAALEHLKERFEKASDPLVIMLQEVCHESLQVILGNPWVQQKFVLSDTNPPESVYTKIPGESFVLNHVEWQAAPFFTLMMISRQLAITDCFRVPFVTLYGRDALVVDVSVFNPEEQNQPKESLRLCTTHLDGRTYGKPYRARQLALISALLKEAPTIDSRIIAGLVGGDIDQTDRSEHELYKAKTIDLKNVWEEAVPPYDQDLSFRRRRRMDKFLYTGSMETVPVQEAQDNTGSFGRFGTGLKTEVEAVEYEKRTMVLKGDQAAEKLVKFYVSEARAAQLRDREPSSATKMVRTKRTGWVSDHAGITVGVKVL